MSEAVARVRQSTMRNEWLPLVTHTLQVFTCSRNDEELASKLREWQGRGFSVQVRGSMLPQDKRPARERELSLGVTLSRPTSDAGRGG